MRNTKEYPNIIYKDNTMFQNEKNLQLCNESIMSSLQKIFSGLGFKEKDTIVLGNCVGKLDYEIEVCYYEIECIVNDKDKYKITIKHEEICEETPTFIITKGKTSIGYGLNTNIDRKINEFNPIKKKWLKKQNTKNSSYTRYYDNKDAYIVIEKEGKLMHLFVSTPRKNSQEPYILPNEERLIKHILDTNFTQSIVDLDKNIWGISLGYAIEYNFDEYPQFSLKIMEYCPQLEKHRVTGWISLQKGKLTNFVITENGETIKLFPDSSWAYEFIESSTVVTISFKQKTQTLNYDISSKYTTNGINYNNLINNTRIKDAEDRVEETKKLVETYFTKNTRPLKLKKTL